jgi:anti-anti-sigma regulatory factor
MSQPSSLKVPPELLDRDRLPELLDLLRDGGAAEVHLDLGTTPRLATPVIQVLAAAARDGMRLVLTGVTPSLAATLRVLGLDSVLLPEGAAA